MKGTWREWLATALERLARALRGDPPVDAWRARYETYRAGVRARELQEEP